MGGFAWIGKAGQHQVAKLRGWGETKSALGVVVVAGALVALSLTLSSSAQSELGEFNDIDEQFIEMGRALGDQAGTLETFLIRGRTGDGLTERYTTAAESFSVAKLELETLTERRSVEGRSRILAEVQAFDRTSASLLALARELAELSEQGSERVKDAGPGFLGAIRDVRAQIEDTRARVAMLVGDRREAAASRAATTGIAGVGIAVVLIAMLSIVGVRAVRRDETFRRAREDAKRARQGTLIEALQFSEDEDEVAGILASHVGTIAAGAAPTMIRSLEAGSLKVAGGSPEAGPIARRLREGEAEGANRECLAIRLGRRQDLSESSLMSCSVCGSTNGTCVPLTVRGQVLGALNVDFGDAEEPAGIAEEIASATALAAPVVANLRSLAMAEQRAATDWLTELPNRGQFEEALERAVSHARRHNRPVSLAMLDLDGFKSVNDTYGHEQGDLVLRATGDAIARGLRAEDFAARVGGDEFAIIFVEAGADGAKTAAGRMRGLLSKSSLTPGVRRAITASVGIASLPEDASDTPGLLRAADTALYASKAEGGDAIHCFSETRAGGPPIDAPVVLRSHERPSGTHA